MDALTYGFDSKRRGQGYRHPAQLPSQPVPHGEIRDPLEMLKIQMGHTYFLHDDRAPRERGEPYLSLATSQVAMLLRVKRHGVMIARGVDDRDGSLQSAKA